MRSALPENPRGDLEFLKFGVVEDRASGNFFHACRGELDDPRHSSAVAYFLNVTGDPIDWTSPPDSHRTWGTELEAQQAERARLGVGHREEACGGEAVTHTANIMFAPLHSLERHNDPKWNREGRTLYEARAIRMRPGVTEIPVLVDHRVDRQVGTVDMIYRLPWISRW